jgi:hypothetical protein
MTTSKTYSFTLTLGGIPEIPAEVPYEEFVKRDCELMDEMAGRLLAAGCDDSNLGARGSTYFLDFDREAESLGDAVGSAVDQVVQAGFKVAKIEIEEDAAGR